MLKLTANRETLIRRASEQAAFARTAEMDNSAVPKNLCWMETLLYEENTQNEKNCRDSRSQAILNDHVKIGPVTMDS